MSESQVKKDNLKDYEEPSELVNEVTKLSHDKVKNLFACYLKNVKRVPALINFGIQGKLIN